jgi:hypothetical protein
MDRRPFASAQIEIGCAAVPVQVQNVPFPNIWPEKMDILRLENRDPPSKLGIEIGCRVLNGSSNSGR